MTAPSETPLTDKEAALCANSGYALDGCMCVSADLARSLETALAESQLRLEGAERWNGIYQVAIETLKAECERLRESVSNLRLNRDAMAAGEKAALQLLAAAETREREKDAAVMHMTAKLCALHEDSQERIFRSDVMDLVVQWRMKWDAANSALAAEGKA